MNAQGPGEPLIVTLLLDGVSQQHFQRLRDLHFPPERNIVPAHVSLFHALPPDQRPRIHRLLEQATTHAHFPLQVTGIGSMGRGVMYTLSSLALQQLHATLTTELQPMLTAQDRQPYRPHIVVQNKTTPEAARHTHSLLEDSFAPFEVTAQALVLWSYLGGPWRHERTYDFRDTQPALHGR